MCLAHDKITLSQEIKSKALGCGFDACGISKIEPLVFDAKKYREWIAQGFHADLGYMERNMEKRFDAQLLLHNAQTVISVLLNYFPDKQLPDSQFYKISKYAYNTDYHYVVKDKLNKIIEFIKGKIGKDITIRAFVDSAPVLDKSWAVKAGLGWIGKNSLLINKNLGSFVFVGEIILDIDLIPDSPLSSEYCGSCTACIDACPTHAIVEPYVVDAHKCISYQTIEVKDDIPEDIASKLGGRIFGCDICQDVCPWNSKAKPHHISEFKLSDSLMLMKKEAWETLEKPDFKKLFKSSPLWRTGFKKIKRNIEQAGKGIEKD